MFISFNNLKNFLEELSSKFDVFAPLKNSEGVDFGFFDKDLLTFDYINTKTPVKIFFLPEEEPIFYFSKKGKRIEIKEPEITKKFVVFGVRACDSYAIYLLDKIFLNKDKNYSQRRKNGLIFCVECEKAGENCFCYAFNIKPKVYDLLFSPTKNGFLVKVGSKKGKKILKEFNQFFEKKGKFKHVFPKKFFKKFDLKKVEKNLERLFYKNEFWKKIADECLACGACTAACPTCYCFDFEDEENLRKRKWSSCFLLEFTRVAGNFYYRKEREERVKQFVYHKLYYFKKRFKESLCVGCGRCIEACPVFIDFFEELMKGVKE